MNSRKSSLLRPALAAVALAAVGAMPTAALAQQVVRDADSGKLRAPNASEAAALNARPAARLQRSALASASIAPTQTVLADGTVMAETDESHMVYSVARRNADGTVTMVCVQGADQARKFSKTPKNFAKQPVLTARNNREAGYELK
jgi:hypothetical protein